ncbi:hypothetical protein LTR56_019059 [Elasticomyces elasticus]|nr:hypothetical protein LTR56_019059 [Elasticomyces elasticus]KAK3645049.1 hypothetical protein LTR22_014968 [Elasticomyces elasticus]KAK4907204.1 hypothetical protein LTR49_023771 [Elasticomyces elasticus]KAK5747588.1 hypothetical protein LTS12_022379 [Elasticomyces elasticus]
MLWSRLYLAAVPIIVHITNASPTPHEDGKISNARLLVERVATSHLVVAENVLPLRRTGLAAKSSAVLRDPSTNTTAVMPINDGVIYAITISFGGKDFEVVFDTGSSDLWLATEGVRCTDGGHSTACKFGPLADPDFQGGGIPNETFGIEYVDHESMTGVLGRQDVGIANITVKRQEVALVDQAHWAGDNLTSGLIGFAYPKLTSASNLNGVPVLYNNWLFNAIDQKLISPIFSLAIERGTNVGQLALGGLPTVAFEHTFASTPILKADVILGRREASNDSINNKYSSYSRYAILPDGYTLNGKYHATEDAQMIPDSGTTLMHMPHEMARRVNDAFKPPAKYDAKVGEYLVRCNAKPPSFAMNIGGKTFPIKGEDLILSASATNGHCLVGIKGSNGPHYILGDTFLKNIVAVFDIGQGQMHFAPHDY